MTLVELSSEVLDVFARSEIERARELCLEDVLIFGTDVGERWSDRESFLAALDDMRELGLGARWQETPAGGPDWVAGTAEFTLRDGTILPARVTMLFSQGKLAHAHYSFAGGEAGAP